MTRSLPATTTAPPSVAIVLAVMMKLGASLPLASRRQKHFWLARMVAMMTSSGSLRKSGSKPPIITLGHSTRPATSSSRPSS
ncbi:hypothetical protein D3C87_1966830 [compost metagenome]